VPLPVHNFQQINSSVFVRSCAFSGDCHTTAGTHPADAGSVDNSVNTLDLCTSPSKGPNGVSILCDDASSLSRAYFDLVGVPAHNTNAMGMLRVKPCDPQASFLYTKLTLPDAGDSNVGLGACPRATRPSTATSSPASTTGSRAART
jgi:hypothetical protein